MKKWSDLIANLTLVTQFGLSLITPLLLCLFLCHWLSTRFGLGGWVYLAGFFFGLGGSGMVAWRLYQSQQRRQLKEKKKDKISFNSHF